MTDAGPTITPADIRDTVAHHRGWFIALGILLIIVGNEAILFPFVTTVAAKIVVGWLFLIGGIGQVIHAFSSSQWKGFLWNLLIGLLYVIVGAWLAFLPFTGIITLTLVLAIMFVVEGIFEISLGMRMRGERGVGWLIASGVIAILAGILIAAGLPSTATWAIGLLVGINMLASGVSFLAMAMATNTAQPATT